MVTPLPSPFLEVPSYLFISIFLVEEEDNFKGIVHKEILSLNVIFWDMMGCGTAHFGWRGLETT